MDPNANLSEQGRLLSRQPIDGRYRLRELRIALAEWIRKGGFEPDWSKAPIAARYYGR